MIMRAFCASALAVIPYLGATAAGVAQPVDFYVTVESGGLVTGDTEFSAGPTTGDFELGTGYVGGLEAGAMHSSGFRAGIEGFFSGLSPNAVTTTTPAAGTAPLQGDANVAGVFGNLAYEYPGWGDFRPFVEGGIGMVRVGFRNVSTPGVAGSIDDADWGVAAKAGAGFAVKVIEQVDFTMSYNYLFSPDLFGHDTELDFVAPGGTTPVDVDFSGHLFGAGIRYRF